jgi:hypothetical protein
VVDGPAHPPGANSRLWCLFASIAAGQRPIAPADLLV